MLDVNGLLIHRTRAPVADPEGGGLLELHAQVTSYCVYDRPGLRAFVSMVLQHFVVGVWSSAKQHNLVGLVHHIFGRDAHRLAFVWGQERCTCIGHTHGKPLFVKELARLWAEPPFAAFGPNCTLLVDDDEYKAGRNPPHTAIHPVSFTAEARLDSALSAHGELWTFLQAMAQSGASVTEFLQSNLFVNTTNLGVDEPDELMIDGHIEPMAARAPEKYKTMRQRKKAMLKAQALYGELPQRTRKQKKAKKHRPS